MASCQVVERAISFTRISRLVEEQIVPHIGQIPSTSQWYRFRERASTGDSDKIAGFLNERKDKKKTKKGWIFQIERQPFYKWINTTFIFPVKDAGGDYEKFRRGPYRDLGFSLSLPDEITDDLFNANEPVILKKALCQFIDHVLLLAEDGLCYKERWEGNNQTLEVLDHGSSGEV